MGKTVCVTGASGYIASWLIKLLLQRGYTVRGTVRTLSDPNKVAHLNALEGAQERLQLFEANLTDQGSFDSVVDGCAGVFHTASPVLFKVADVQKELLDPAVNGTLNVLRSCKKASTVERVVVTSSMAAVRFIKNPPNPDLIDETWCSDPSVCEERKEFYALSKTLAERAAWKFAEENGIDLIVLHPGYVTGPLLQPTMNFSSQALIDLIKEGNVFLPGGYSNVDVRDVALAHILALENSSANGRYCLVGRVAYASEMLDILKQIFPSLNIPSITGSNQPAGSPPYAAVSKEKASSLGLKFTPLEVTFKDTIESLIEKNFFTI